MATIISHLNVYNASEVYGCGNDYFTSADDLHNSMYNINLQRCMDAPTTI